MSDDGAVRPTSEERKTKVLRARFDMHIIEWWIKYADKEKYPVRDYYFIVGDAPHEVWQCDFVKVEGEAKDTFTIFFLWNGDEVKSYDDLQQAFVDFVNEKKEKRLDSKLKYYTSPLTISAALALLLVGLIAYLEIAHDFVPDQLWSVFTAVVAFYFGKESSQRTMSL